MSSLERSLAAPSRWDGVGQLLSALCVVHCVVLPAVLVPAAAAQWLGGEGTHRWLFALVLLGALAAFIPGWRLHRRGVVPVLAGGGLALLGAGAFLVPEGAGERWEMGLTLGGGLLMAVAHGRNRALCRECCPPEAG
ncbi:MerC family mercury resistance protein [Myxococcus sp. CA051A]|uniref:MerC family mercury resistance protein n=1 Tax=Myxococcus sp. CA051A TaxID=2741739 RepID=UPI00157A6A9C|nr:MerC family mercury resistance protein [Myxococcus sp. CA051A]NTX62129.1 MerC family mercury resistance protein [Myxococcus sp. CA051A]